MNSHDEEIRLLLKETLTKGKQEIEFNHGNLLEGEYFIKLIIQTEKIIDISTLKLIINN